MIVNMTQAEQMLELYFKAGLVPMLHGSPAIGKSDVVKHVAKKYGLKVIDIRLSQCDTTDLNGMISIQKGKAQYIPMDIFPLENEPIPEGYSGWCLFFDEISSAPRALQAASYRILLDRQIGQHKLHKNVAICCAGNLDTDNAIVEEMSTALQSRLVHIQVKPDLESWLNWADNNGINYLITGYVQFQPDNLYNFSPEHSDKTYASPRTWAMANKVLQVARDHQVLLPMLAGTLGEGVAREFLSYISIEKELPKLASILADPTGIRVPEGASVLYALGGSIAEKVTMDNIGTLMKFIKRLPIEHQIVTLRRAIRRNTALAGHKEVAAWTLENRNELF